MAKYTKAERAEAVETLRGMLKPGDTIKSYIKSVSRSGMSRTIVPLLIGSDGSTRHIGFLVCKAIDASSDGDQGVKMGGCGMDMGFHMTYSLSHALYPGGFGCVGRDEDTRHRCPSNDHSNGDRDYTPHATYLHDKAQREKMGKPPSIEPHWHQSGGYALRHDWI